MGLDYVVIHMPSKSRWHTSNLICLYLPKTRPSNFNIAPPNKNDVFKCSFNNKNVLHNTPPPTWAASAVSAWSFQSFRPTCEVKLGRFEGIKKKKQDFQLTSPVRVQFFLVVPFMNHTFMQKWYEKQDVVICSY